MVKPTQETTQETDETAPTDLPVELLPALAVGVTLSGMPVRFLVVETVDGRRQRFELPDPAEAGDFPLLRPVETAIVDLFRGRPADAAMKGAAIAYALRRRLSDLKHPLRRLRAFEILEATERKSGYTRGKNFPA